MGGSETGWEPDPLEVERLMSPPPPVPSFWRYLWEKNHWAYHNVVMGTALTVCTIIYRGIFSWWGVTVAGALLVLSLGNAIGSWRLWAARKKESEEAAAWVEKISTGERAFPRDIAQAMSNLAGEGKVSMAAYLAMEYLKATDPEARRLAEEFDALPADEKARLHAEAVKEMDK